MIHEIIPYNTDGIVVRKVPPIGSEQSTLRGKLIDETILKSKGVRKLEQSVKQHHEVGLDSDTQSSKTEFRINQINKRLMRHLESTDSKYEGEKEW